MRLLYLSHVGKAVNTKTLFTLFYKLIIVKYER